MSVSKKVVQGFIEQDPVMTGILFEEYKNLLYFIIATYVKNSDEINDVLSETYIKAIEHRYELRDYKKIKSYLTAIAKNESLQHLRRKKETTIYIEEIYGEEDKENAALDLLGSFLTNKETIVVYYRAVFSYSWKEIYQETGIPISTAKLIYKKAMEKLRKGLK